MNILASRVTVRRIQLGPLARLSAPAAPFVSGVVAPSPRQRQKGRILFLVDRDVRQERHGSGSDARLPTALRHLPGCQQLAAPRPLVARAVRKQDKRTAQQRYRVWMLPID